MKEIVIVGAGVAGLTLGYRLSRAGYPVTLVEREAQVGGLARSFHHEGFIFDLGPHVFHTQDQEVWDFIHHVLGDDSLEVTRSTALYAFDRYLEWPLRAREAFRLPLHVMGGAALDMLTRWAQVNEDSFAEYTRACYGETLYRSFFKPYLEKFLQIPCEQVHVDWGKTAVDKRVQADRPTATATQTLWQLARDVLQPRRTKETFLYPGSGGIATFCRKLEAGVRAAGGRILTGDTVRQIVFEGDRVRKVVLASGEATRADHLVWSGNLLDLFRILDLPSPPLRYLAILFYNFQVEEMVLQRHQWIYYSTPDTIINRVGFPGQLAGYTTPAGREAISVEVSCYAGDDKWRHPDRLVERTERDLVGVGLVPHREALKDVCVLKAGEAYPVYDLDYRKNLSAAVSQLARFEGLGLLGRLATFWYNNMDHSIRAALDMAQDFMNGTIRGVEENISRRLW